VNILEIAIAQNNWMIARRTFQAAELIAS